MFTRSATPGDRKRTAVLVVHGMGSQRPLDTVRGIVDAIWLDGGKTELSVKRIWTHPERGGVDDIDLPVVTTNFVPGTDHRRIDFHELYWAHVMSETRAVAVLLWLFELARMGPRVKPSIGPVYWGVLIFLSVLVLSVSLLSIQIIVQFAQLVARSAGWSIIGRDLHSLLYVLFVSIAVTALLGFLVSLWKRANKLAGLLFITGLIFSGLFGLVAYREAFAERLTTLLLPILVAAVVVKLVMGWWGVVGLLVVLGLSVGAGSFAVFCFPQHEALLHYGQMPWSVTSFWSSVASCYFIAVYIALYASFLQPYLGDAARYFRNSPANVGVRREIRRQAVSMLQALHLSGEYDRIVVVAHSLGTVVAYDMLRAYYSRINEALPEPSALGEDFDAGDQGKLSPSDSRKWGREIIDRMARTVDAARQRIALGEGRPDDKEMRAWLVTDFVTLGSPLTHALYLMCRGKSESELRSDFERRTREREFPTCPPSMLDGDYRLTFENPRNHLRQFHHGGQFALTRWTNLFFPASQLL
jgi:hypothetical protein